MYGSVVYTDDHPSYLGVSKNLNLVHRVLNHSQGFVSYEIHTNNFESFWSHLKSMIGRGKWCKKDEIVC